MQLNAWLIPSALAFFVFTKDKELKIKEKDIKVPDIKVFRDPERFRKFLKKHDNDFEKVMVVMDEMIFGKDNKHAEEVREIQRRMEQAQKNIDMIKNTSSPNFAVIKDMIRLIMEIIYYLFQLTKIISRFIPLDLFFLSFINPALTFVEQLFILLATIEEKKRFNRRKEVYERFKKEKERKEKERLKKEKERKEKERLKKEKEKKEKERLKKEKEKKEKERLKKEKERLKKEKERLKKEEERKKKKKKEKEKKENEKEIEYEYEYEYEDENPLKKIVEKFVGIDKDDEDDE